MVMMKSLISGLAAIIFLCSCIPTYSIPTETYLSIGVKIIVMEESAIESISENQTFGYKHRGLCMYNTHPMKLYVPFSDELDKNGKRLPDFRVLGHELWHSIEGDFHETSK
jgi:hypothetical protein